MLTVIDPRTAKVVERFGVEARTENGDWWLELAPLVSERIKTMDEVPPMVRFLFVDDVEVEEKAYAKALDSAEAQRALAAVREILGALPEWTAGSIEEALHPLPEQLELKPKVVFQAVRAAITGTLVSPPLFESLALLGREKSISRLDSVAVKP